MTKMTLFENDVIDDGEDVNDDDDDGMLMMMVDMMMIISASLSSSLSKIASRGATGPTSFPQ